MTHWLKLQLNEMVMFVQALYLLIFTIIQLLSINPQLIIYLDQSSSINCHFDQSVSYQNFKPQIFNHNLLFLKVPTTLVDLFIYRAHVTSLTCKANVLSTNPTHELILSIQITRGRVDCNGDSAVKSPCWHQVSNL